MPAAHTIACADVHILPHTASTVSLCSTIYGEQLCGVMRLNATTSFVWVYRATAFRRFQASSLWARPHYRLRALGAQDRQHSIR